MKTLFTLIILFFLMNTASAQTPAAKGQYAKLPSGLNMYYEVHGTGFPLVLIHGGGSTIGTNWGRILPELARKHKVIAVEMQAHGHTADIDRPLSFKADADDISALLKHLKIEKADIFGFSNGASTTLELAIRHPEQVNRIIFASAFYKKDGAPAWFWDMMSKPTFEGMPQPYKDAFLKINPDKEALMTMYNRDVARMQAFPDIPEPDIKAIKGPALILLGDKDVVRPEHALEMVRTMPNAQLAILPGLHGECIGELTTQKPGQAMTALPVVLNFLADGVPK